VTSRATDVRGGVAAHRQAEDDWLEAEALVEEHRRRAEAAADHASERLRAADALRRSGRCDPRALGTIDAAHLHLARARDEAERLRDVEARCAALRARADAARAEVDRLLGRSAQRTRIADGRGIVVGAGAAPLRSRRCG
jgi:hypothetical protein